MDVSLFELINSKIENLYKMVKFADPRIHATLIFSPVIFVILIIYVIVKCYSKKSPEYKRTESHDSHVTSLLDLMHDKSKLKSKQRCNTYSLCEFKKTGPSYQISMNQKK
jgi:hypothetical protein